MIYDALQLLKERRSVKKYKDDQISEEQLDKILEAGLYAASGKNGQKTIMLAVTKKEDVKMLSKLNAEILGVDIDPFYNAPAVIVVFADKNHPTYLEDGSLVLGNLLQGTGSAATAAYRNVTGQVLTNADTILSNKVRNIETVVKMLDTQSDIVRKSLKNSIEGDSKLVDEIS